MPEATTGYVLVVGPDGAGKSTVVDAIAERVTRAGIPVARAHHRPGLLAGGGQGGAPVTDPRAEAPRSVPSALAKLGLVLGDHLIGYLVRWRPMRRGGLLLLERGWFDMVVDPRRYRLPVRWAPAVSRLGRLLPRPDVVLMLSGEPQALHDRKPEIGVDEVGRQIRRWRDVAPSAGREVLEVDTVLTTAHDVATTLIGTMARQAVGDLVWRSVPFTPQRLALRIAGRGRPALALYQPQSGCARAGATVARRAPVRGGRAADPVPDLAELCLLLGLQPEGAVSMDSSTADRVVIATCARGRMETVVKIGRSDDGALRREAEMLTVGLRADVAFGRPAVLWAGKWRDRFVLATGAVVRHDRAVWTPYDVVPLAQALGTAGAGGTPVTHGDLAPWNLVRSASGPVLLDWEFARSADEPLHDIAHFVVQAGALLGRYPPERAVALLCAPASPGDLTLRARGRATADAVPLLADYLAGARPTDPRAIRYTTEILRLIGR